MTRKKAREGHIRVNKLLWNALSCAEAMCMSDHILLLLPLFETSHFSFVLKNLHLVFGLWKPGFLLLAY